MSQSETARSFTTVSVTKEDADELRDIRDAEGDPNLARTVRRILDYYEGAP